MPTNPVSLALVAGPLLDDLMAAIEDRTMDSNRLTDLVGRLRLRVSVLDVDEAADAIEALIAALKDTLEYAERLESRLDSHDLAMCEDTEIKSAARAAYLGEKHDR